jgi:hypothetical protein
VMERELYFLILAKVLEEKRRPDSSWTVLKCGWCLSSW